MSKDLSNNIEEWLTKTGYPLELYCADQLTKIGFTFKSSTLYKDFETSLLREADHVAWKSWAEGNMLSLDLKLIIECKKSDKPLLLFETINKNEIKTSLASVMDFYSGTRQEELTPLLYFACDHNSIYKSVLPKNAPSGYKIVQAMNDNDKAIYSGLIQLAKALKYELGLDESVRDSFIKQNTHSYIIPTLLVDTSLFKLNFIEGKEKLEEIDFGFIDFEATWDIDISFKIPIVTKKYLNNYLENISLLGDEFFQFLKDNPKLQLKGIYKRTHKMGKKK